MYTKRCGGHVCGMSACMTAGVRKTSFVSEIERSLIGLRHANITGPHRDPLEVTIFQFIVRNMCSRSEGGVMNRKRGPDGNSKTAGRTACVKGQEADGL